MSSSVVQCSAVLQGCSVCVVCSVQCGICTGFGYAKWTTFPKSDSFEALWGLGILGIFMGIVRYVWIHCCCCRCRCRCCYLNYRGYLCRQLIIICLPACLLAYLACLSGLLVAGIPEQVHQMCKGGEARKQKQKEAREEGGSHRRCTTTQKQLFRYVCYILRQISICKRSYLYRYIGRLPRQVWFELYMVMVK